MRFKINVRNERNRSILCNYNNDNNDNKKGMK